MTTRLCSCSSLTCDCIFRFTRSTLPLLFPPLSLLPFPSSDRPRCVFIAPQCRDVAVIYISEMRHRGRALICRWFWYARQFNDPAWLPRSRRCASLTVASALDRPLRRLMHATVHNFDKSPSMTFQTDFTGLVCLWVFYGPETHATHSDDMTTVLWYLPSRLSNLFPL